MNKNLIQKLLCSLQDADISNPTPVPFLTRQNNLTASSFGCPMIGWCRDVVSL